MMYEVDAKQFIDEIKKRPALWDKTDTEHLDKQLRKKNWDELVDLFLGNEDAPTHVRNEFERLIQKKWKNIRDSYCREIRKIENQIELGQPIKISYTYFNRLHFLSKVIKIKDGTLLEFIAQEDIKPNCILKTTRFARGTITLNRDEDNQESQESNENVISNKRPNAEWLQEPSGEEDDSSLEGSQVKKKTRMRYDRDADDDELFLMSLLKPLKKIPRGERLSIRMELLQVMINAQKRGKSNLDPLDTADSD